MRCYLASPISLWFILIAHGLSTPGSDICSSVIDGFNLGSESVKFVVDDTITVPTDCFCEITTYSPASYLCPLNQSAPCPSDYYCTPNECSGSIVNQNSVTTCISMSIKRICSRVIDKVDSCSNSTNFTIGLLMNPSTECNRKSNGFQIILQTSGPDKSTFREAMCTARSLTPDVPSRPTTVTPTTLNVWTTTHDAAAAATAATKRNRMIGGIVVGVVGGTFLSATIIIVNVVWRRRQGKPRKPRDKKMSQTRASGPSETAYESYAVPVSVPYDNAINGTTSGYQTLAYDNEAVGELNDGYIEANEPEETSDHNGYDKSRNEAYSMRNEMGKEYDNVRENLSSNVDETTVTDNDFYA
jgi:hypothetical protein